MLVCLSKIRKERSPALFLSPINLPDAIRQQSSGSRIFITGSSEIFGINQKEPVTCSTPTINRTSMERQKQMRFMSFVNFKRIIVSILVLVFFLVSKVLCVSSILYHRKVLWGRVLLQRVNTINFTWVTFQRNVIGFGSGIYKGKWKNA